MKLTTTLLLVAGIALACGHDERLDRNASSSGGGGFASMAGAGGVAGTSGSGGTPSGGGSSGDAAPDAPDAPADSGSDAVADSSVDSAPDSADGGDGGVAAVVPDFSLVDENPASSLYKKKVSPRDYLGQVSAWYFGHST